MHGAARSTAARYSLLLAALQVCGARGGGDGAAQGVFLAFAAGQAFMLACESSRQRNVCILLIRTFAAKGMGHVLVGPSDSVS